jgi:HSP20 family protein
MQGLVELPARRRCSRIRPERSRCAGVAPRRRLGRWNGPCSAGGRGRAEASRQNRKDMIMANIAVQREPAQPAAALPSREGWWDPFRTMRELLRWDPFGETLPAFPEARTFAPAFEVKETRDAFQFKADLPGIEAKDIEVRLTQNRLTVSGKREAEKTDRSDTYYMFERSYGSFTRAFTLPEGVDAEKIQADLKDGVLSLVLPKRPEMQPKEIKVKAG